METSSPMTCWVHGRPIPGVGLAEVDLDVLDGRGRAEPTQRSLQRQHVDVVKVGEEHLALSLEGDRP